MTFQEQLAADVDAVFLNTEHFAVPGVYTDAEGAETACDAVVEEREQTRRDMSDGPWEVRVATLHLSADAVPNPRQGEAWSDGAVVWTLTERIERAGALLSCDAISPVRKYLAQDGYMQTPR